LLDERHPVAAPGYDLAALAAQHLLVVRVNADAQAPADYVEFGARVALLHHRVLLIPPAGRVVLDHELRLSATRTICRVTRFHEQDEYGDHR